MTKVSPEAMVNLQNYIDASGLERKLLDLRTSPSVAVKLNGPTSEPRRYSRHAEDPEGASASVLTESTRRGHRRSDDAKKLAEAKAALRGAYKIRRAGGRENETGASGRTRFLGRKIFAQNRRRAARGRQRERLRAYPRDFLIRIG